MTTDRYLTIYLRDHLAMGRAGLEFVRRMAAENRETSLGIDLEDFAAGLEEEIEVLEGVMDRLDVEPSQLKMAGAWLAEKAGRLKFNGELTSYSPLSRLLEVEFLSAAVQARRGLWRTMEDARRLYPQLREVPVERFIDRAERQARQLDEMHRRSARSMLKSGAERDRRH